MAPLLQDVLGTNVVSPYDELMAYEYLYSREGSTLKKIVEATVLSNKLPREALYDLYGFVAPDDFDEVSLWVAQQMGDFAIAVNQTPSWPTALCDSKRPSPLLYYRGDINLIESRTISIVGARKATDMGKARAAALARDLSANGITIATGLAAGIDTAAAQSAIANQGKVIGVIGTPINKCYPKENRKLQDIVAHEHLLLSQVPLYKYSVQPFKTKRYYFPERNELMAAVSDATVIVEASDTSGTLTQAKACLSQGRPLFIMRSCAENSTVSWPRRYIDKEGVYVLDSTQQLLDLVYG